MIAVLGAGSWGTALAATLARNTQGKVFIWGREPYALQEISFEHTNKQYLPGISLPINIQGNEDIVSIVKNAHDLLIVVPSVAFREMLLIIKPYVTPAHRIVWATKGLEPTTGRFLHELVIEIFGAQQKFAVLAGPSFAKEVAMQLPTAVTIATNDEKFGQDLLNYFHTENFRVYISQDYVGAQVGGVMKNILAVAAGMSDGLGFGANARAALITRGMAEMMRFGLALGAQVATLQGLAGVGDVILTCTDNQSRNRRFGIALAEGQTVDAAQAAIGQTVEAAHNAEEVCRLAAVHNLEMPIAAQVFKILTRQITPRQAVTNLLSRKPSYEWV